VSHGIASNRPSPVTGMWHWPLSGHPWRRGRRGSLPQGEVEGWRGRPPSDANHGRERASSLVGGGPERHARDRRRRCEPAEHRGVKEAAPHDKHPKGGDSAPDLEPAASDVLVWEAW